jgi:hypothetical protein
LRPALNRSDDVPYLFEEETESDARARTSRIALDGATGAWFDREIAGCSFADERLSKRLRNLRERMGDAIGASIPLAR